MAREAWRECTGAKWTVLVALVTAGVLCGKSSFHIWQVWDGEKGLIHHSHFARFLVHASNSALVQFLKNLPDFLESVWEPLPYKVNLLLMLVSPGYFHQNRIPLALQPISSSCHVLFNDVLEILSSLRPWFLPSVPASWTRSSACSRTIGFSSAYFCFWWNELMYISAFAGEQI